MSLPRGSIGVNTTIVEDVTRRRFFFLIRFSFSVERHLLNVPSLFPH